MATDNNIKNYSAADIEKYHKGLLSPKERHDLEKAALDDPFLADAMEGYAIAGIDHAADLDDLKTRLAEKMKPGKLVSMKGAGKSSFPWLRVAALVIIIAGAGLMAQQFLFTGTTKDIAQAEQVKKEEIRPGTDITKETVSSKVDTVKNMTGTLVIPSKQQDHFFSNNTKDSAQQKNISSLDENGSSWLKTDDRSVVKNLDEPAAPAPIRTDQEKNSGIIPPGGLADKKEVAKTTDKSKEEDGIKKSYVKDEVNKQEPMTAVDKQANRSTAPARKLADNQQYRNLASNTFRGRVTDASNVGVPFANVTNAQDNNAGTYADAQGFFNLTYPDTVLTVQVRSIGFENTNIQLRNNVPSNQVILQEDQRGLSEVVINNQKPNSTIRREISNVKLEEPEPADGWENYDTYLTNNVNMPDEIKTKQNSTGEVELSFEVNKNGEPVNIKVVKSLCTKCDQEAIRLIKEGPKWKRKAKKGTTTVKVPFIATQ